MKKKIIRISALFGVLILAFLIYKIGPNNIWAHIKRITWENFLILMLLRTLYWLLRTINWKVIFDAYKSHVSLFQLFIARMYSHAISQLTPSAQVGGEAARVFMVECPDRKVCLASVIIDKTIEFLSAIVFTVIGVAVAITRIALPVKLQVIFIGFSVLGTLFLVFILSKQKKGLLGWMVELLAKIKIKPKFVQRNLEKIRETDRNISDFYRHHRPEFLKTFLLYGLMMLYWAVEIHLTLVFIGVTGISLADSFVITALGNLAFIFPLIPASLGIYEATYVGLSAALGMGTGVGFTLVLIRRVIALLWAGIGLLGTLVPGSHKKKTSRFP